MNDAKSMAGRVALVTGASSGIGRATAELFAARGATVVLAARRVDELVELTHEITSRGGEASYVETDVSVSRDVETMVEHVIARHGQLDFCANSAGVEGRPAPIVDLDEEEWDRTMGINLRGTFLCLKYQARAMLKSGRGGAIVNVGSVNSFLGYPTGSAYVASKHGQIGLTSVASAELAAKGIRVNLVCPGFVDTPMHRRARATIGDAIYDKILFPQVHMRRAARPEEIAHSIVFLCSEEASYISGTTLTPDGGYTLTM